MRTRPSPLPSPCQSFPRARSAARTWRAPGSLLAALLLCDAGWTQTTSRLSLGPGGVEGNNLSVYPDCSADGRYVAFYSAASNLVPLDTNVATDIFVIDRLSGTPERVSVDSSGVQGNGPSNT